VKTLFVTPMLASSGEAVTVLHVAEDLSRRGGEVSFLSSGFTGAIISVSFPGRVRLLTEDGAQNRRTWDCALEEFDPNAVVFAEYPHLHFSSGISPFDAIDEWVCRLDDLHCRLFTLDHVGYCQGSEEVFFGPPHLSAQFERLPSIPESMEVLLPCPLHEPGTVRGRRGYPFQALPDLRGPVPDEQVAVRKRLLGDAQGYLIFHSAPSWAVRFAKAYRLPYYRYLPAILEWYLAGLDRPVTVISVNGGSLLKGGSDRVRFVNLPSLPVPEFERAMLSADLVIGESMISSALAKAVAGGVPAAVLINSFTLSDALAAAGNGIRSLLLRMESERPGCVFPHQVFPIWPAASLESLSLFRENSVVGCFLAIELYGGQRTREALHRLLADEAFRGALRGRQADYNRRVDEIPSGAEELWRLASDVEAGVVDAPWGSPEGTVR
jgi:hypothetical protein